MNKFQLPEDSKMRRPEFLFGVATSSYQIEGGAQLGGRTHRFGIRFATSQAQLIMRLTAM